MATTPLYKPNLAIIISGPSGSGKSTVIKALCAADDTLQLSVSATTRTPRPDERDGVAYHFLSGQEFDAYIQQGRFLEWAEYGDNRYGTLTSEITDAAAAGRDAVLEIEVQGALQIRKQNLTPIRSLHIFIVPPSFASLERRLRGRETESEAELKQRLTIATSEIRKIEHYDYWVTNPDNNTQHAVAQIQTIIQAERCRIDPQLIAALHPLFSSDGDETE